MSKHTLIQSYVKDRYFVSTILRGSSVLGDDPCYFETIVWEWDFKTKKRGELVEQESCGKCESAAILGHAELCVALAEKHEPCEVNP